MVHNLPMSLIKNSSLFPISFPKCTKWYAVDYIKPGFRDNTLVQGLLLDPMREFCNETNGLVPDFREIRNQTFNSYLADTIARHNQMPLLPGRDMKDVEAFPDGTISFRGVSESSLEATLQINDLFISEYHTSNGLTKSLYKLSEFQQNKSNELNPLRKRLEDSASSWPVLTITEGLLGLMDSLARSAVQSLSRNTFLLSGYAYLIPNDYTEKFVEGIYYLIGSTMFPSAVGMVLPLFMYLTVLEKSSRVKHVMQMHGLREIHYWISNVVTNYLLFLCIYFSFYFVGRYVFEMAVFIKTSSHILVSFRISCKWGLGFESHQHVINMLWGCNLIGVGMLLQLFISSPRTANILGHTISASLSFYSISTSLILYASPMEVPRGNLLLPQMSFIRIYYHISKQCMETGCFQEFSQFSGELHTCMSYFVATALLYPALAVIVNICWSYKIGSWHPKQTPESEIEDQESLQTLHSSVISTPEKARSFISGDCVRAEAARVRNMQARNSSDYPLVCNGVSKRYTRAGVSFQALYPAYLSVAKGEVLGLLGPNGAGKTTLISILTGLVEPNTGEAWIGGSSILTELPKVYKSIGVCPQFDLFWEDLTVEEHLLFYLRLKGSKHRMESDTAEVFRVCQDVELQDHVYKLAKELSGGMKRRLSLAIALIGNPDAIFLDEPTTGLDPVNREIFWGILQRIKPEKSIILTTHLMQEADFLSDRIGMIDLTTAIIHKGKLKCIGTPTEIKRNYGSGLILNLIFDHHAGFSQESRSGILEGLNEMFEFLVKEGILKSYKARGQDGSINGQQQSGQDSEGHQLKRTGSRQGAASMRTAQYEVEVEDSHVLDLFEYLEQNKSGFMIGHFELAQSPLKDVFEKIVLRED